MEPPFDKLDGVISTTSGYIGGHKENPTYKEVSSGRTGHTEAVQIVEALRAEGRLDDAENADRWKQKALDAGFEQVASGPLVRSSYQAHTLYAGRKTSKTT